MVLDMDDMVSSRDWPNLPFDLLRDVSSRLHAAADYLRFHAVCRSWSDTLPPAPSRPAFLESRDELLWAFVQVNAAYYCYHDVLGYGVGGGRKRKRKESSDLQWVRTDRRSLADRILFLGRPSSFAVDAARFGMSGGGCAYFVHRRRRRRRVYKYSFRHKRSLLVEKLPADWDDEEACMWVTPKPDVAPTQEIRERIEASRHIQELRQLLSIARSMLSEDGSKDNFLNS
ncbi:hypothetical protein ACP70R_001785 [Stipagrostis hirtigluma subsp. patula]